MIVPAADTPCLRCGQVRGFYARELADGTQVFECVQCQTRFGGGYEPPHELPAEEQASTPESREAQAKA